MQAAARRFMSRYRIACDTSNSPHCRRRAGYPEPRRNVARDERRMDGARGGRWRSRCGTRCVSAPRPRHTRREHRAPRRPFRAGRASQRHPHGDDSGNLPHGECPSRGYQHAARAWRRRAGKAVRSNEPGSCDHGRSRVGGLMSDVDAMQARLDTIWEQSKASIGARVDVIESAAIALLEGTLDAASRQHAKDEAHKLAGVAGTFGFPASTDNAREAEGLLDRSSVLSSAAIMRLSTLAV